MVRNSAETEHSSWTPEDWGEVLLSDQSTFNKMGSDGKNCVSRCLGEEFSENCVIHTVKHGGGSNNVSAGFRTVAEDQSTVSQGTLTATDTLIKCSFLTVDRNLEETLKALLLSSKIIARSTPAGSQTDGFSGTRATS